MIFGRGRGSGRHQQAGEPAQPRHAARRRTREEFGVEPAEDLDEPVTTGPYDISDAPADEQRVDLGSLQVPAVEGVELRVQVDPNGQVQQVALLHRGSVLQLGVFAAPRSEGIWDEVRAEIAEQLRADGAHPHEVDGEYGVELRARVRTPDGPTDVRFVGVDGPRWLLRAVYQGPAGADPTAAGPLAASLHGTVVDRGEQAMPVREPLPLRLPRELSQQAGEAGEPGGAGPTEPGGQQARREVSTMPGPSAVGTVGGKVDGVTPGGASGSGTETRRPAPPRKARRRR